MARGDVKTIKVQLPEMRRAMAKFADSVSQFSKQMESFNNRRRKMGTITKSKREFRQKLAKVRSFAEQSLGKPTAVAFWAEARPNRNPMHLERAVICEAYRHVNGKNPAISVEKDGSSSWDDMRVQYGMVNGFALAYLSVSETLVVGAAKCHGKDDEDWELGVMLATFRAAEKLFRGRHG